MLLTYNYTLLSVQLCARVAISSTWRHLLLNMNFKIILLNLYFFLGGFVHWTHFIANVIIMKVNLYVYVH